MLQPTADTKDRTVETLTAQSAEQRRVAQEQHELFMQAFDGHKKYLERAIKCEDFYFNEQWQQKDLEKLAKTGRPALTINQILPLVNVVLGEQSSRRAEVKFKPTRDASHDDATVMNKVYGWITDANMYDWVESQVFADGVIMERGFFDIRVNFDENLMGNISITSDDPCDVIPGIGAREYDPDTWPEVWSYRWMSLDDIELEYGVDKRKALENLADSNAYLGTDSMRFETRKRTSFTEEEEMNQRWFTGIIPTGRGPLKEVRVIERQVKRLHWQFYFVDPMTGDKKAVPPTWDEQKMVSVAQRTGVFLHKQRAQKIRWTVSADSVLLHDDWSPYRTSTKVPFFPFFRRGRSMGVVTPLVSPQEMFNKVSSQVLHVVNSTANSGWIFEQGSLANMTSKQLEERGAETGLVLEVKKNVKLMPTKIQANQIPTGLERVSNNAYMNMKLISGINEGLLGTDSAEVSGVVLDSKERRGQVALQTPRDNLARTRHYVVRKVLELIQQFITEQRILTITNERPRPGQEPTEELVINAVTAGEIMNDVTRGSYTWVIASQPARDNFGDSQFGEALAMRSEGVLIPDDRIVEYSNLERKFELAEEMRAMSGRGTPTEEDVQMQDFMRQFELMQMQLALSEMEARISKLRSEAALNMAKGMAVEPELQRKIDELEATVALEREGFELRRQLAQQSGVSKLENTVVAHHTRQKELLTKAQIDAANSRFTQKQPLRR